MKRNQRTAAKKRQRRERRLAQFAEALEARVMLTADLTFADVDSFVEVSRSESVSLSRETGSGVFLSSIPGRRLSTEVAEETEVVLIRDEGQSNRTSIELAGLEAEFIAKLNASRLRTAHLEIQEFLGAENPVTALSPTSEGTKQEIQWADKIASAFKAIISVENGGERSPAPAYAALDTLIRLVDATPKTMVMEQDLIGPASVLLHESIKEDLAAGRPRVKVVLLAIQQHVAPEWNALANIGVNAKFHNYNARTDVNHVLSFVESSGELVPGLRVQFDQPMLVAIGIENFDSGFIGPIQKSAGSFPGNLGKAVSAEDLLSLNSGFGGIFGVDGNAAFRAAAAAPLDLGTGPMDIHIGGSSWSVPLYSLSTHDNQRADVSWINTDTIEVTYAGTPDLTGDELTLHGDRVSPDASATAVPLTYEGFAAGKATWRVEGQVLPDGRYRLDAPAMNPIQFDVLHGSGSVSIASKGVVNFLDFSAVAGNFGQTLTTIERYDHSGDGVINFLDFSAVAGNFGNTLPDTNLAPQVMDRAFFGFNEGPYAGTELKNLVGYDYDVAFSGASSGSDAGPAWIEDTETAGKAISFDTANDRVTIPTPPVFNAGSDQTISLWYQQDAGSQSGTRSLYNMSGGPSFMLVGGVPRFQFGSQTVTSSASSRAGWNHLAVSIDRSADATLFLNGAQVGQVNVSGLASNQSSGPLVLGHDLVNSIFVGKLDEVQILSGAFTADMVLDLMDGKNVFSDLVEAKWLFDGQGSTVDSIISLPYGGSYTNPQLEGTLFGATRTSADPREYVIALDGDDDLNFGDQLDVESAHRTISLRFRSATGNTQHRYHLLTNGRQHDLVYDNGTLLLEWGDETAVLGNISTPHSSQYWSTVEIRIDRGNGTQPGSISLYRDGMQVGQNSVPYSVTDNWFKATTEFHVGDTNESTTDEIYIDDLHICDRDPRLDALSVSTDIEIPTAPSVRSGEAYRYDFSAVRYDSDSNVIDARPFGLVGTPYAIMPNGNLTSVTDFELYNSSTGSRLTLSQGDTAQYAGAEIFVTLRLLDGCGDGSGFSDVPLSFSVDGGVVENHAPVIVSLPDGDVNNDGLIHYNTGSRASNGIFLGTGETTGSATFNLHDLSTASNEGVNVDIVFLIETMLDPTAYGPLATQLASELNVLDSTYPNVTFSVGVAHFGGYGGLAPDGGKWPYHGDSGSGPTTTSHLDRPFWIGQEVVPLSSAISNNALDGVVAGIPGFRVDGNNHAAFFEAIYQVATGSGFDGDLNGSSLEDIVFANPQDATGTLPTAPGGSGDVPPFWALNHNSMAGNLGGVGFRQDSVKLIVPLVEGGLGFTAEPSLDAVADPSFDDALVEVIEGAGATVNSAIDTEPVGQFPTNSTLRLQSQSNTFEPLTPYRNGISIQDSIDAANSIGAFIVPVPNSTNYQSSLEDIATLTGARGVDLSGEFGITGDGAISGVPLGERAIDSVESFLTNVLFDVEVTSPSSQLDRSASTLLGHDKAPGATVQFNNLKFHNDGKNHQFVLQLEQQGTHALASNDIIPVTMNDGYLYLVEAIDPDGDELTYTLTVNNVTASIEDDGRIDHVFAPSGTYVFNVTVSDGVLQDSQQFTVVATATATNTPPVFIDAAGNGVSVVSARSTAGHEMTVDLDATDADDEPVHYALASNAPAGMSVDPSTGVVTWTPSTNDPFANRSVNVFAIDTQGLFDTVRLDIDYYGLERFSNSSPEIQWTFPRAVTTGDVLIETVEATDADSDTLTFTLGNAPTGLNIDKSTGQLVWQVDSNTVGQHHITVTVTDSWGGQDTLDWSIRVLGRQLPADPFQAASLVPLGSGPVFDAQEAPPGEACQSVHVSIQSSGSGRRQSGCKAGSQFRLGHDPLAAFGSGSLRLVRVQDHLGIA